MEKGYILIQDYMIDEYGLNMNEAAVLAIITGFNRDGKFFFGSQQYIADKTGISRRSIVDILAKLTKKKLITKQRIIKDGYSRIGYYANRIEPVSLKKCDSNLQTEQLPKSYEENPQLDSKKNSQSSEDFTQTSAEFAQTSAKNGGSFVQKMLEQSAKNALYNKEYNKENNKEKPNTIVLVKKKAEPEPEDGVLPFENLPLSNSTLDTERKAQEKEKSCAKKEKETKHTYGQCKNVLLTDNEFGKIGEKYKEDATEIIENFSLAKSAKGYSYKSDYAAILKWGARAYYEQKERTKRMTEFVRTQAEQRKIYVCDYLNQEDFGDAEEF